MMFNVAHPSRSSTVTGSCRPNWNSMIHLVLRLKPTAPLLLMVIAVGCAPQVGTGITEDVIEIEEIEMSPRPTEELTRKPASAGGEQARREVDAEKAAADKAIDEAAQSIESPPQDSAAAAAPADLEPEVVPLAPAEPAVAEPPQPEPTVEP